VERGPFRGRIAELLLDSVHVLLDQVFNPMGYVGPAWSGSHVFFSFLPSAGNVFLHGRQVNKQSVLKYPRDHSYHAFCSGPIDCVAISVRHDTVEEESAELTGQPLSPAMLRQALCVLQPDVVGRFQACTMQLLSSVATRPELVENPEWRRGARRSVMQMLLEVVQIGTSTPQRLPPPSTRAYIVDKSIEFMRANMGSMHVLSDICGVLRVSPRTLRYSFEEIVGVSPSQYLLSLRLRAVRNELREGGGENGIHRVAERHGFCHMGRFASYYQQAFGEQPSATRRDAVAVVRTRTPWSGNRH
jgi:AraC-like DNA-binding protein